MQRKPRVQFHITRRCLGAGCCARSAPAHFLLHPADGFARVAKQPGNLEELRTCRVAQRNCPVNAIVTAPAGIAPSDRVRDRRSTPDAIPVDAMGIDHVNLFVRSIEESSAYYQRLLDVSLKEEGFWRKIRWRILGKAGRYYLCMYEYPDGQPAMEGLRINHVGFHVRDIEETVRRLHALGITLEYGDRLVRWPKSKSAYIKDPNGIMIEFTEKFGGGLD